MSVRNLQYLFEPKSVAVIGASAKSNSVGATVLQNLLTAPFKGPVYPVSPHYKELAGQKVYATVADLPAAPDLAVLCTPPSTVPRIIRELGERGTRAAIVLTAGMGTLLDEQGRTLKQAMLDAARPFLLRVLGPNGVGLVVPGLGLNASFAHTGALPGKIAFISQSGALVSGLLDRARSRGVGFSKFISLGESADIDFGDLLDYLASDAETRSILLYMENIGHARKFMSAARAAARTKQVLVLKAGRAAESERVAVSHSGALAGSDDVYDAAIRRAGMLRVYSTEELFSAVETLARARPISGERLAIMSNGGSPGILAADALVWRHGVLASLAPSTMQQLDGVLPSIWSHGNPVDIIGDAPAERYVETMKVLLQDPESDAVLVIHSPTAIVPAEGIAAALAPLARNTARNILSCWLGGDSLAAARTIFSEAGIAVYDTPEEAVQGFMQIVQYQRNQKMLMQVPPSLPEDFLPDLAAARAVVREVLASGRRMLSEPEAKSLLAAYGIPVVQTRTARDVDEAAAIAESIGFPVAIKIVSPDLVHKSDVGGVALELDSEEAVRVAARAMTKKIAALQPTVRLEGFTVQSMARCPEGHELIVGVATDPVFGPVILFGQGGIAVEVTADHAVELPPLNMVLARELVSRTRVAKLLQGYRNRPAADIDAICRVLVQISHLVADFPEIAELDINPLLADGRRVIVLDARVHVEPLPPAKKTGRMASSAASETVTGDSGGRGTTDGAGRDAADIVREARGASRLAIRPYPKELEQWIQWGDRQILVRPIRPEDGAEHLRFFHALDPEDVRMRIFTRMRELQPWQLARLTQIDYDREMALVAVGTTADGDSETLGVARAIADPDNDKAEFAIIVRSDQKGLGLGHVLMEKLIDYCRERGIGALTGEALSYNRPMMEFVKRFGFQLDRSSGEGTVEFHLDLQNVPASRE